MNRVYLLAGLVLVGVASSFFTAAAQQAPALAGINPANFTGVVTESPTTDIRVLRYTFAPSARANWHSHAGGQTIIVENGRMRVFERGAAAGREFGPTETYRVAKDIVHWHGATPDGPLTQVAVSFGTTTWLEKVSDADYAAAARRP